VRARLLDHPGMARLLAALLLVVGVAAMHHLVASGCLSGPTTHDGVHAVHAGAEGAESADSPVEHVTSSGATDVHPAGAAVCLAVLVLLWSAAPVLRWWRDRRDSHRLRGQSGATVALPMGRPPDLVQLSVSRT